MDDSFELEYADDLEALGDEDINPPSPVPRPSSKRSLHFQSPDQTVNKTDRQPNSIHNTLALNPINGSDGDSLSSPPTSPSPMESPSHLTSASARTPVPTLHDELDGDFPRSSINRKRYPSQNVVSLEDDGSTGALNNNTRKKQRLEERLMSEEDIANEKLIQQILQHRSETLHCPDPDGRTARGENRLNDDEDLERVRVLKHIPRTQFVSSKGYDGMRVYMKLWDEDVLESEYASIGSEARSTNLLPVPVCVLREQFEEEASRRKIEEAQKDLERVRRQLNEEDSEEMIMNDADLLENNMNEEPQTSNEMETEVDELAANLESLWVDKYAPRKYTELLSEEAINRNLLHWLKLWDFAVFKKEIPKPIKNKNKSKKDDKNYQKFKPKKYFSDVDETLDKHNRPEQKIALLCGPPGLGKTTLAHIVARHAGYNVVEMNASDDRTVDVFKNKLEASTQMKAVIGNDPRPNCLVIDEIDGAPAPAINVLLNTIKRTEESAKKKREGSILLRPIICICNDQYVPALRELRKMALVLNFPQTESTKLASRLYEVVRIESLKADMNTLLVLCEKTDNDIRSCLNTLQFVKQKEKELTLKSVRTMSVGQKDSHKSLFSVWHEVFSMPRQRRNHFVSIHDLRDGNQDGSQIKILSPEARFQNVLSVTQSAGEYERVIQGLFDNYLEARSKDPHLIGLNLVNEWLCFADGNHHYISRSQDYSMMKYTSYLPIVFHFIYATFSPPKLKFPHSQTDAKVRLTKSVNMIQSLMSDMTPTVRKFVDTRSITLDLLPPLLEILQPTLRPVNTQLYSTREKEELSNVVRIMISYNMIYQQEKSQDGPYVYVLEPNVEEIARYPGLKQRKQLTYAAKQLIAREIEVEKMRRSEPSSSQASQASETKVALTPNKSKSALPNHLQKLEAKAVEQDEPCVNFFEKFTRKKREKTAKQQESEESQEEIRDKRKLLDTLIWFHYKEGFSNAVKRSVRIQDLL